MPLRYINTLATAEGIITMQRIYERQQIVDGVPTLDLLILGHPSTCDFSQVLHQIGIQFSMTKEGRQLCRRNGGLTMDVLMDYLTPEMLAPYYIKMLRPSDITVHVDRDSMLVSQYEAEFYRQLNDDMVEQFRQTYEIAKRFARRLEKQRTSGHRVVSNWGPELISAKALVWANQCVTKHESNWEQFFADKLEKLIPAMSNSNAEPFPTDTECVED